jgi:Protein of unknown function (DUF3833)
MWKKSVSVIFAILILGGCATVNVTDYAQETPKLDLKQYFNGVFNGHGVFMDRSGKIVKRFVVIMDCTWQGDVGTLDESFTYSDGTTQKRIWTIKKSGDRYIGTASDVVGEAIGHASGNALRWQYVMALPVDGKTYHVDFDDWMYLVDGKVMLNKSVMSKFGFRLGEVILSFTKP